MNKNIILGRIGTVEEPHVFEDGNKQLTVTVATDDGYRNRETGEWVSQTTWHRVVVRGTKRVDALLASDAMKPGNFWGVEGQTRHRTYPHAKYPDVQMPVTEILMDGLSFPIPTERRGNSAGGHQPVPPAAEDGVVVNTDAPAMAGDDVAFDEDPK